MLRRIVSIALAGSVFGCAAEAGPTGPDDPGDMTDPGGDDPGDPGPTAQCGDGVCNGDETADSCASDCAASNACTASPDTCTGDNVCVAGSCVAAFGHVYKLFVEAGSVPEKDANSAAWDPFGGLPDPYVSVFLNGDSVFSTAFKSDTIAPVWHESATITVAAGSKLQLDVYDDDLDVDGYMFSCFDVSLTADLLRKHGGGDTASCQASAGSTLRFFFAPQ